MFPDFHFKIPHKETVFPQSYIFHSFSYFHCFNVFVLASNAFCLSYCWTISRFLIKTAFGGDVLIRERRLFSSDCEMVRRLFESRRL